MDDYILIAHPNLLFLNKTFNGCDLGQNWLKLDFLSDFLSFFLLVNSGQGYCKIPFDFRLRKNTKLVNPAMHVLRRQ
jgi:hypothetical protein